MYMFAHVYVRKNERSAEQTHSYNTLSTFLCISFKVSLASILIIDLQVSRDQISIDKPLYLYWIHNVHQFFSRDILHDRSYHQLLCQSMSESVCACLNVGHKSIQFSIQSQMKKKRKKEWRLWSLQGSSRTNNMLL